MSEDGRLKPWIRTKTGRAVYPMPGGWRREKEDKRIVLDDHGYEEWERGDPKGDPYTIREVVFEAPGGAPERELHAAADAYMVGVRPQQELNRWIEDEEADEYGPAARVLRLLVE